MRFHNGVLHLGEIPAPELIARFGSPLYVYESDILHRQIDRVGQAFKSVPFKPFYAMKANFNSTLLRLIRDRGFGCDAVSPGEVFLAKQSGFSSDQIWFTCSNVSDTDLHALNDSAVVINLNSLSEVDRFLALGLTNRVALRVNPEIGAGHHRDVVTGGYGVKFGIELPELDSARMMLEDSDREIVGIHAHIGSGIAAIQPLMESARVLLSLIEPFPQLRWVNFGGGISVPYCPGEEEFPLEHYGRELAAVATDVLQRRNLTAILEPGRFIVAESGTLLATVTTKRVSGGFEWLGCDTGFNHLVRPSRYGSYHHIVNASRGSDEWLRTNPSLQSYDDENGVMIAGNLCESGDVFTREAETMKPRRIHPTKVGEILAFCDAGAYGFSMASHYNARLLPAEVLVHGAEATVIRKRQDYDSLLAGC